MEVDGIQPLVLLVEGNNVVLGGTWQQRQPEFGLFDPSVVDVNGACLVKGGVYPEADDSLVVVGMAAEQLVDKLHLQLVVQVDYHSEVQGFAEVNLKIVDVSKTFFNTVLVTKCIPST